MTTVEDPNTDSSADSNMADAGSNQSDAEEGREVCLSFCDISGARNCLPLRFILAPWRQECRSYGFIFAHVGVSSDRGCRLLLADQVIDEYTRLKTIWNHIPAQSIDMTTVPVLTLTLIKFEIIELKSDDG